VVLANLQDQDNLLNQPDLAVRMFRLVLAVREVPPDPYIRVLPRVPLLRLDLWVLLVRYLLWDLHHL
jgi:hypothetical protein